MRPPLVERLDGVRGQKAEGREERGRGRRLGPRPESLLVGDDHWPLGGSRSVFGTRGTDVVGLLIITS